MNPVSVIIITLFTVTLWLFTMKFVADTIDDMPLPKYTIEWCKAEANTDADLEVCDQRHELLYPAEEF